MKLRKLTIFLCVVLCFTVLFGCSSLPPNSGSSYVEGQDHQFMYQTDSFITGMAESPDGYYFMVLNFLYYMDKDTMKPVVLCGKPDCLHGKETDPSRIWKCSGYFLTGATKFIAWWDGNLYAYVKRTQEADDLGAGALVRISPDGSKREEIYRFSEEPGHMAIHRGKLYFASAFYDLGLDANYRLRSINLTQDRGNEQVLFEGNRESGSIQSIWCYGNRLYFLEQFSEDGFVKFEWRQVDLMTGTVKPMQNNQFVMGAAPDGLASVFLHDQNIESPENRQLWKTGFDGESREVWFSLGEEERYYFDGRDPYVYTPFGVMDNVPITLKRLDSQGNPVGEADMNVAASFQDSFFLGDEKYLFFSILDEEQHYHLYSVSKAELSTGVAQPREVIEIEEQETTAVFG